MRYNYFIVSRLTHLIDTNQDWKVIAKELDEYLKFDAWKLQDEDRFYDYKLVRKVKRSLRTLREKNDVRGVLGVLETCIRANFAGVESARLYSETFLGSKNLVESYFDEQETALKYIRESYDLSNDEKRRFFKSANTNFGTSALCLSGGGSFGYYHFGVVKAFLKNGVSYNHLYPGFKLTWLPSSCPESSLELQPEA